MGTREKLIERLKSRQKDFTWDELVRVLVHFDYELIKQGKTGGSRREFIHKEYWFISLHEPHPAKILKRYALDLVIEQLEEEGLI